MDIEVDLLHEAGDIGTAVARLEEICSRGDASSFDLVRLAIAQFRYGKKDDARDTIDGIKASELGNEPSYILLLAQLKQQLDVPGYLDDAYLARQVGASHPDVHLGYFSMFQGQEKEWEEPTVIGPGCAVLLKHGTTEQWWHIQEESEEIWFPRLSGNRRRTDPKSDWKTNWRCRCAKTGAREPVLRDRRDTKQIRSCVPGNFRRIHYAVSGPYRFFPGEF